MLKRRTKGAVLGTVIALVAMTVGWVAGGAAPAGAAPITIVTIGFDDGTVDQFDTLPILDAHGMHATFFINSGPILANDADHMSVDQLTDLFLAGNEIAGHTVTHANIQPLSTAEARAEVCTDRNTLLGWGFEPTNFAYPFGSFDSASETVVRDCGYNSARTVSGVSIHVGKNQLGEIVPPVDPYATRTPPNPKKATKLSTLEDYVLNAEAGVASSGQTLWIQFVFHRFCAAQCGAYTVQPDKFTALLDFLSAETAAGRMSVQTTAQVIGGPVNPAVPA